MKMDIEEIRESLKKELKKSRYIHTLGVMDTAVHLAEIHGGDVEKARYAGLLHDCAKCLTDDEKVDLCRERGIEISKAEAGNPALLHAKCGAVLAKERYGVEDKEILHAIRFHTTGCPDMTLLDKIIYIADYIEPNRDQAPHLAELRALAETDLEETLYRILKDTVDYLLVQNPDNMDEITLKTYQYYKKERARKKGFEYD